jgi:CBS domain-containing protein
MPATIQAKTIMTQDYETLTATDSLSKAFPLFEGEIETVIILDNGKLGGVLAEKDVARIYSNPDKTKIRSVLRVPPSITPDTTAPECARLMLENRVNVLPVVTHGELEGVVTESTLLKAVAEKDFGRDKISVYMTPDLITANPEESIASILRKFRKHQISRIPIVKNNTPIGIVSLHDIITRVIRPQARPDRVTYIVEKDHIQKISVRDIMTKPLITAYDDSTVKNVVNKLVENRISSIPIIGRLLAEQSELSGIITRKDLLEPIAAEEEGLIPPVIYVGSKIHDLDRAKISDILTEYTTKSPNLLKRSFFNIYVDEQKESFKEQPHDKLYATLRVHTPIGRFIAAANGWGEENLVKNALEKIDRQIEKKIPQNI